MNKREVMKPLLDRLLSQTQTEPSPLWFPERSGIRCVACGHRCFIPRGLDGICKVRHNRDNKLHIPWGYVAGLQLDPIEKKPFFHVMPGTTALSFGMLGCDFHCAYCQNWVTSQALRDPNAMAGTIAITPKQLVAEAKELGARVLTSTYNEPLITSEWAVAIFEEAHQQGLKTSYVSNGNATPEVLNFIRPHVDYYKVDLKGFTDKGYRELGGVLENIKRSIREIWAKGFWLEVVTLLIPGFNDGDEEIKQLTEFLVSVSPDIPWHATAFYQNYKMTDADNTSVECLMRAAEWGKKAGLNFIYLGNRPGMVEGWENTYCPGCQKAVIVRRGYRVLENHLKDGKCLSCERVIAGRW